MHIEEKSPTSASEVFCVHFPVSELNKHIDTFIDARAKNFKKDGFRPGKAPLDVVRSYLSEDAGRWAEEQLANEGWRVLRQKYADRQWQGYNSFEFDKSDPETLKLNITCETWPALAINDEKLPKFDQVKLTASDETVQKWIDMMVKELRVFEPQEKSYTAEQNDIVQINLFFRHKGKEIQNSRVMNTTVELTPNRLASLKELPFASIFNTLIGAKEGDVLNCAFKATKNYSWGQRKLVGDIVECECRVLKIEKLKETPNEKDLATHLEIEEKDIAQFVRQGFQDYADLVEAMHNKRMIFDHLNDAFNFDILDRRWKEEADRINQAFGGDENQEESEDIAKRRVRLGIIVEQLRKQCEKLTTNVINRGVELYSLTHQLNPISVLLWLRQVGANPNQLSEKAQDDWQSIMGAINEWSVAHHVAAKMKSNAKEMEWNTSKTTWQDLLPPHFLEDEWVMRYVFSKKERDQAMNQKNDTAQKDTENASA